MDDINSEGETHPEFQFASEQSYFDKSMALRTLIGVLLGLSLFLFLHYRQVRVEVLELNSIAPSYVVAQVDFDFLDDETTAILKQEAVRDVGKIYQLDPREINQRRIEFENFLIYNQEWRSYVSTNAPFEEMYLAAEAMERVLLQLRFTDARTIHKSKQAQISTNYYLVYTPTDLSEPIALPAAVWNFVKRNALSSEQFAPIVADFVTQYAQQERWAVEEDSAAERLLRKRLQSNVSDKYTFVPAGSRIVDQGEKVTTRHVAMLQSMKKALNEGRSLWHPLPVLGNMLLAGLLTAVFLVYLKGNYPAIIESNQKLGLLAAVIMLTLFLAKLVELFVLTSPLHFLSMVRYPIFVAFAAIMLCSMMHPSIATFVSGFLTLVLTLTLAFEEPGFMLLNVAAALIAILSARSLQRRKEIFMVCAKAWFCCILVLLAMQFSQGHFLTRSFIIDLLTTGLSMLITAVAVVGLLPLLESTFNIMTNVTLTEYMDPNNDLLRRLTIEAPGTYQHSIVVGNIAENAAVSIGANGLFCRVATLYHDIGKMATPQYFTENQPPGINMHQLLTPQESASVIIAHVSEGVSMARKAGLPEPFIDVIKEHHGTGLVYYFYREELKRCGGDLNKVNEAEFRYAGPKPRSKESGIIMLADTIEAASRSLEKLEEGTLTPLANRLVREKLEEGQLDHCLLTLEELSTVVNSLVKTLVAYGHTRIKYPAPLSRKDPFESAVNSSYEA